MAQQYLVESWKGLLQYITNNLLGKGYYYWHCTELPVQKQDKWLKIDEKLMSKYETNIDKFKRHRRKAKGLANFVYIRWEQYAFIFHTEGTVPDVYDDKFYDIRQEPLFLKVGELTTFVLQISGNGKVNVKLSSDTYQGLKAVIHNTAKRRNPVLLQNTFKMVNGLPSYGPVLKQKRDLATFAIKQAEKNQIRIRNEQGKKRKMNRKDFWIYTKKPTVKVFSEFEEGG
ncbi:hypothetical protein HNQ94_002879 [Salirhabdus euzebyi]|uniref:Uncharacterized protein n=1 Tax=Salirhabdus euzebyi TaxID=394506 RepID=A0A841Q7W6_9BACI|nr:hypothetical protein [Salirhabdus euzebyi]MBB6454397.1 hypothetical protein [Salirhabdus euzebyi]